MILIDKEKFIEEVRKRKYSSASIKLIEEQPEVKAIPIEWLERKGMILAANKYDFSADVIRIVIKEWKKENDKQ